jgi:outer membrane lipopolysaccharide assembly protein LptE/RlpB
MKLSSSLTFRAFIFSCVFLNSCGYELRTFSKSLSNQVIYFEAGSSDLNLDLRNKLNINNNLISNRSSSDLKIKIKDHSVTQYVGSIGMGARTTQVRLDYQLVYEIGDNNKTIAQSYKDISYIDFNQSDLLAFESEIEMVTDIFIERALKNMEFLFSSQFNEVK